MIARGLVVTMLASTLAHADEDHPTHGTQTFTFLLAELLEYRLGDGTDTVGWDVYGWSGGDYRRVWFKSEGNVATTGDARGEGELDLQLLYGRLIAPWWDLQIGARVQGTNEGDDRDGRVFGVIALQGLAPGRFELEASLFVSHEGDVSARSTGSYALYLTQRAILEPRFELEGAVQEVEELGVGSGLTLLELGLRLRYEIRRELAPYVGIGWDRALLDTAEMRRARDEAVSTVAAVAGVRVWW